MFPKNLTALEITNPECIDKLTPDALTPLQFVHTMTHQTSSQGWTPVHDGQLAFSYMGYILLSYKTEKKNVPPSAVKELVKVRADELAQEQGHKLGRKALKELKAKVVDELMARAIPASKSTMVWIDTHRNRLMIDSCSDGLIGDIMGYLYSTCEMQFSGTPMPSDSVLTSWLHDEGEDRGLPAKITVDDFAIFEHPGEAGKTVRYDHADMFDHDVLSNLDAGATTLALALTYDDRLSFVLKDCKLYKLTPSDILKSVSKGAPKEDVFQNDFYLFANETAALINYLKACA
jgi:recombination associated protein RdgC